MLFSFGLIAAALPARAASPIESDPVVREALAAESKINPAAALDLFLKADVAHPDEAFILQKVSKQYSDLAEFAAGSAEKQRLCTHALSFADRAVAKDPKDAVSVLSVAICYGKLALLGDTRTKVADTRQVKIFAERALALDPNLPLAHYVLGRWHFEVATTNGAEKFLAGMIYGDLPPASLAEAIHHLHRAVELEPQSSDNHVALGLALLADRQRDAARTEFAKALGLSPQDQYDVAALKRAKEELEKLK